MADAEPQKDGSAIDLSFAGAHIAATGSLAIVVVLALVIVGAVAFSGYRIEQGIDSAEKAILTELAGARRDQRNEHTTLSRNQGILTCMAQLTPAESARLRSSFSNRALEMLCPWISAPPPPVAEDRGPGGTPDRGAFP